MHGIVVLILYFCELHIIKHEYWTSCKSSSQYAVPKFCPAWVWSHYGLIGRLLIYTVCMGECQVTALSKKGFLMPLFVDVNWCSSQPGAALRLLSNWGKWNFGQTRHGCPSFPLSVFLIINLHSVITSNRQFGIKVMKTEKDRLCRRARQRRMVRAAF